MEEITQEEDATQQQNTNAEIGDNEEIRNLEDVQYSEEQEKRSEECDDLEGHEDEAGIEYVQQEHEEGEKLYEDYKEKVLDEDDVLNEPIEREQIEEEQIEQEQKEVEAKKEQKPAEEELVEEEVGYVEEPPPDPTAPFDFSDSKEALKEPFQLRPEQLAEVEQLWELYQKYTPVYTDIDRYVTEKELVYMLKSLLLMTFTPEQLHELIAFCVRPPHPEGHITFEQFVKMVTIRQREFPIEDELRSALQIFDPGKTGSMDREYLKEVLAKQGNKMPQKQLDKLIKEVDISNDGTIGVEDVVGTMCIDLNKEDLIMLMASIYPPAEQPPPSEEM